MYTGPHVVESANVHVHTSITEKYTIFTTFICDIMMQGYLQNMLAPRHRRNISMFVTRYSSIFFSVPYVTRPGSFVLLVFTNSYQS